MSSYVDSGEWAHKPFLFRFFVKAFLLETTSGFFECPRLYPGEKETWDVSMVGGFHFGGASSWCCMLLFLAWGRQQDLIPEFGLQAELFCRIYGSQRQESRGREKHSWRERKEKNIRSVLLHRIRSHSNDPARYKHPSEAFPAFLFVLLAGPLTPEPSARGVEVVIVAASVVVVVMVAAVGCRRGAGEGGYTLRQ